MCKANNLDRVENQTYLQSHTLLQCMPGYQSLKAKYGTDPKPFFAAKNFEIMTNSLKGEAPDQDPDENEVYHQDRHSWKTQYNSLSGLTSLKTASMQRQELDQNAKDLEATLYVAPPKFERLRTRGKFDVQAATNGKLYSVERQWHIKANPYAHEQTVKREELDRRLYDRKLVIQKQIEQARLSMEKTRAESKKVTVTQLKARLAST